MVVARIEIEQISTNNNKHVSQQLIGRLYQPSGSELNTIELPATHALLRVVVGMQVDLCVEEELLFHRERELFHREREVAALPHAPKTSTLLLGAISRLMFIP